MTEVKILVAYHIPAPLIKSEVFIPIHVGRKIINKEHKDGLLTPDELTWLYNNTIGDDTGDNISHLNRYFNELTAIYWAWKNLSSLANPEFIGLTHYRRQFLFYQNDIKKYESITYPNNVIAQLGRSENIKSTIGDFDVYAPEPIIEKSPLLSRYEVNCPAHITGNISTLNIALSYLDKQYPHLSAAVDRYFNDNKLYLYNMFIMRTNLFTSYCSWLFDILLYTHSKMDYLNLPYGSQREIGYLAERLTSFYILHLTQTDNTLKHLPIIVVSKPNSTQPIEPAFDQAEKPVNIFFSYNAKYITLLASALSSIVDNASSSRKYDIICLGEKILKNDQILLCSIARHNSNVSIRCFDISPYAIALKRTIKFKNKFDNLFLPRLFPNFFFKLYGKIAYFDADIIATDDVANFYDIDLGNKLIGACDDFFNYFVISKNEHYKQYISDELKLDINNFQTPSFNIGVILFNIYEISKSKIEMMRDAIVQDNNLTDNISSFNQDLLNLIYSKDNKRILSEWNSCLWALQSLNDKINFESLLTPIQYSNYLAGTSAPKILHFSGKIKPYSRSTAQNADWFWIYCRKTPFYEKVLANNVLRNTREDSGQNTSPKPAVESLVDTQKPFKVIPKKLCENQPNGEKGKIQNPPSTETVAVVKMNQPKGGKGKFQNRIANYGVLQKILFLAGYYLLPPIIANPLDNLLKKNKIL